MPAPKRPRDDTVQNQPAPKRSAAEAPSDDNLIVGILRECLQEQSKYIECIQIAVITWYLRFERIQPHLQYQLKIEKERIVVKNATKQQIKFYEKEIDSHNRKEAILKIIVEEMTEQEDKLEKIAQEIVGYKGFELQSPKKTIEAGLHASFEEKLNDALKRIPTISRDDSEMEALPKLRKYDLDEINRIERIDWSKYSIHFNREFNETTKCRELNEAILSLDEEWEESMPDYDDVQARKDSIKLYDENRNCPIHAESIRNNERTDITDKLEQLIRKSFEKKASVEKLEAEEKNLKTSKKQREDLLKSIQEDMNADSLRCSVCVEPLTNGEQSLRCPQVYGSCGHTVCASCMPQFKARISPYQWTCHECRAPSDKVLTNWALMKLIKAIPGQPQREVVGAPEAVPIVPDGWRVERRPHVDPYIQDLAALVLDFHRRRARELAHNVNQIPVFLPPIAPAPVIAPQPIQVLEAQPAPALQLDLQPDPMVALQMAPAPEEDQVEEEEEGGNEEQQNEEEEVEDHEEQVDEDQVEEQDDDENEEQEVEEEEDEQEEADVDNDDEPDVILEERVGAAPVANAHAPAAALQEQMDDDLEIIKVVNIRAPPQIVENGIEYIVLD